MSGKEPADQAATAAQWSGASDGWARWAARAGAYLVPATQKMLDLAGAVPGSRVLDIGCGSGEQTIIAARRVGETGHVLAIDIAAPMIAATERNVAAAGLGNVATRVCAAEALAGNAGPFDAAIGRLVLMLIPDPISAACAVFATLKPGGRFAAIVPGTADKSPFSATALDILARHGGKTLSVDRPGIHALGDPAKLGAVLRAAGFTDVTVSSIPTIRRMESAAAATAMIRDGFAFYRALVADQPQPVQDAAWAEVERALARFEDADGLAAPGDVNLAVGRKPER